MHAPPSTHPGLSPPNILLSLLALLAACGGPATPRPSHLCRQPVASEDEPTVAQQAASRRPVERPPVTLIRGATVWTADGKVLERADVLLADGVIEAVGAELRATTAGRRVEREIDARGKHVTPGLIDPHSHMGVYSVPALRAHQDGNELVKPVSPEVGVDGAFWPQDPALPRALAAGVTTAHIVPGSANLVGGQTLTIKLVPARSAAEMAFPGAPRGLKMACGENPKSVYGNKGGPSTRMGSVARVRAAFALAREHQQKLRRHRRQLDAWRAKQRRRGSGQRKGDRHSNRVEDSSGGKGEHDGGDGLPPAPPSSDLGLDALVEVLEGKRLVHWHCYRADEMLAMLQLARETGFRVRAFHHATEAYKIRDVLARSDCGAVVWVNWWGFKVEAYDTIPENAGLLLEHGALAALHSDSPAVIQRLNHEAALAYFRARDAGLRISRDQAIALVTLNPARVLGIEDRTGSLSKGKAADVVIWDGDPLSVYSRVDQVFIDGHLRYQRSDGARPTDFELSVVPRPPALPVAARPAWGAAPADRAAAFVVTQLPPAWRPAAPLLGDSSQRERAEQRADRPIAIVGAEVYPMTAPPLLDATVIVRHGRIAAVGWRLPIPADAAVIQASGRPLTPGLIAAESALGLVEIAAEPSARDLRPDPGAGAVHAALRAWDALNPASPTVAVNRIEGITSAVVRPFGGLVSGQAAAWDLTDGLDPDEIALAAPVAMYASFGLAGARAVSGSRALALQRLRRLLADARLLRRARRAVEARRYRRLSAPLADLEALVPVVEGRQPLVVEVRRAADILAVLRLARSERIRVALSGADEAWRVAPAIAAARVPVLLTLDSNLPATFETLGARYDNAARLHRAGVAVGFSAGGGAHTAYSLRQRAGQAVAWGLSHHAALAALTVVPARIFGLVDRGAIAVGHRANLVLWSGDPFELSTRADVVLIHGREVPRRSRQVLLRERYRRLPAR